MIPFRDQLAGEPGTDGWHGAFTPDWSQGRGAFGGLVVAAAVHGARPQVEPGRPLRTVLASFAGPVAAGPVSVEPRVLRAGRAMTTVESRVVQEGETRLSAILAFGGARGSAVNIAAPAPPEMRGPDGLDALPYIEGVTPTFTRHVELRWALGGLPFTGGHTPHIAGWCRLRAPSGVGDPEALLALLDAWPAPVLSLLDRPTPASSATWAVDLLASGAHQAADAWWRYEARVTAAHDGYAFTQAFLWDESGRAVARGTQLVAVFG